MKVVVVGAGYAGTIAANRLRKKAADAQITVINPRADFVERVRLHEEIAGSGGAATPLTSMLRDGIETRVGTVDALGQGAVVLEDGTKLDYDYLVIAIGSGVAAMRGTVPVGTWEGAQQARAELQRLDPDSSVTVIGGGLTGIETASEIAGAHSGLKVRLIGETLGPSLPAGGQRRVRKGLNRLGVEVVEGVVAAVENTPHGRPTVRMGSGEGFASDLTLWAIVGAVPDLAARNGLAVDADGRAIVDENLRSVDDPNIFVVGDCAAVPGARLSCATATPQGAHAADTLARINDGRSPKRYSMGYNGQAVSLGRKDGLLQMSRRDDTPRRLRLSGRSAAFAKERISRYAKYGSRTANYVWMPAGR